MNKITTLKGFRDILPNEMLLRQQVEQTLLKVFKQFNFVPIETPTLEYQELLLGKYGDEADKLVYKFKDNGDRAVALRYDQTVPTARFITQNQNDIPKYFRRYQTQNVFRSEKPQAGRYREFKQCDIDIFGSVSPLADAEILACVYKGFKALSITDIKIVINDRNLLVNEITNKLTTNINVFSVIATLDKLDKKSETEVIQELVSKGLKQEEANEIISSLRNVAIPDNLRNIVDLAVSLGIPKDCIEFNPFLARGLDYYTGLILEVKSNSFKEGSLGGGGRYDMLIEKLVGKSVPAVGFAFGFDRVVELIKRTTSVDISTKNILVCVFNDSSLPYSLKIAQLLRDNNINCEVYVEPNDSLGNQLKYASNNNFGFAIISGQSEMQENKFVLKNLQTKEQIEYSLDEINPQLI